MNENKVLNEKFVFRQLMRKDVVDLMNAGFPWPNNVILPLMEQKILQATRLIPREIGVVAYHSEEKLAIGYLMLVNHNKSLFSIRQVFTNPHYRGMGVATGLLNYALGLARESGGKKVFLDVVPYGNAKKLYVKLGFRRIVNTSIVFTAGSLKLPSENQTRLFSLNLRSKSNKQTLYSIYENCMGAKWIDFFEITVENILNGFSQDFRRPCFKAAFVNDSANAFALVSNIPPLSKARIELCTTSDDYVIPMLKNLFQILRQKGITYVKIVLLNVKAPKLNDKDFSLLKKMDHANLLICMGKSFGLTENASLNSV